MALHCPPLPHCTPSLSQGGNCRCTTAPLTTWDASAQWKASSRPPHPKLSCFWLSFALLLFEETCHCIFCVCFLNTSIHQPLLCQASRSNIYCFTLSAAGCCFCRLTAGVFYSEGESLRRLLRGN